jgi:hypothetical protein
MNRSLPLESLSAGPGISLDLREQGKPWRCRTGTSSSTRLRRIGEAYEVVSTGSMGLPYPSMAETGHWVSRPIALNHCFWMGL